MSFNKTSNISFFIETIYTLAMKKPIISFILAMSDNHVIGNQNALPWHLPDDLAFFKKHTLNKPIIMGRKTFESIGKPLPKRTNIIVSSNNARIENTQCFSSLNEAIDFCKNESEIMIIGGAQLFKTSLPLMNRLYLTKVHENIEGDTTMPEIDLSKATLVFSEFHEKDERHKYAFTFQIWDVN